jgi:hypothetical protein
LLGATTRLGRDWGWLKEAAQRQLSQPVFGRPSPAEKLGPTPISEGLARSNVGGLDNRAAAAGIGTTNGEKRHCIQLADKD